jgi:hypothetical protein
MAGASAERQESGFIRLVSQAIRTNKNNPITILGANGIKITGVTGAKKYTGRQTTGSEPYTDIVLLLNKGKKLNVSMKGEEAPSLAGGGLRGIELASPGLGAKYFKQVYTYLKETKKLNSGDKVPDVYGKIPDRLILDIIVGNESMGGPIDYMYVGPMNVIGRYDAKKNVLTVNGNFSSAEEYAKENKLYFRLRARREDQRFDPNAKDAKGVPKIYGKSPSRGDSAGRLVVVKEDSVPSGASKIIIR